MNIRSPASHYHGMTRLITRRISRYRNTESPPEAPPVQYFPFSMTWLSATVYVDNASAKPLFTKTA